MKKLPRCDFHIHTKYLKCANASMEVFDIVKVCESLGVKTLGITDHLNTLDKLDLHWKIKEDIERLNTSVCVHFGVELNFMGVDGKFAFSEAVKEKLGFQFAIGGIHGTYLDKYDLKKIVDIQHRHHLMTCRDPLVDVLVHPYWFGKGEFDGKGWPWFDSMRAVPEAYARELGQTARETGTAIEINGCANLENPAYNERFVEEYIAFMSIIAEEGACFSLGSDAHDINSLKAIKSSWKVADRLKLPADRIWMPKGSPMAGGGKQHS